MACDNLSDKQRMVLEFIIDQHQKNRTFPTFRAIANHIGQDSPNAATHFLSALSEKGCIDRDEEGNYILSDEVLDFLTKPGIPVVGNISAGPPVIADLQGVNFQTPKITLEDLFGRQYEKIFALEVSGQSMIDAGIQDGDFVFLIFDEIPDGEIGAIYYQQETTLKRIYRVPGGVRLEPANPDYSAALLTIDPKIESIEILGRYVGHMNKDGIYKQPKTRSL